MNEGATRKRDGNARREAERDEASRKKERETRTEVARGKTKKEE